jgi:hypothetical protein
MRLSPPLLAILLLLGAARGQDPVPPTPAPLPAGQVKVLQAVVMEVKGTAQSRSGRAEAWTDMKVNDVLEPGTVIRTGRESHVALRVGANATVLVERQSRVALPEIVQDGEVLRTRVAMSFGKADVRVDRIGLRNDFEVATPTATLAVRGTVFLITWNAIDGFRAVGVSNNRLRAIEIAYLQGVEAFLSGADESNQFYKLPALAGFYETYVLPLRGAITPDQEESVDSTGPGSIDNPRITSSAKAASKQRGGKPSITQPPPPPTDGQQSGG